MTNEQLIEKFNPDNAGSLTAEDLETMRSLSDAQIEVLAKAYPNKPTRRVYLRLYDTTLPEKKQVYNLSTWQNLNNVRKFSNKKNLIPFDFKASPSLLSRQQHVQRLKAVPSTSAKKIVVDLSAQEAAEELKKLAASNEPKQEAVSSANKEEKQPDQKKEQVPSKPSPVKGSKKAEAPASTDTPADQNFAPVE